MKKILSIFDTWMMALTFSEANEHEIARQILNDKTAPVRTVICGIVDTVFAKGQTKKWH